MQESGYLIVKKEISCHDKSIYAISVNNHNIQYSGVDRFPIELLYGYNFYDLRVKNNVFIDSGDNKSRALLRRTNKHIIFKTDYDHCLLKSEKYAKKIHHFMLNRDKYEIVKVQRNILSQNYRLIGYDIAIWGGGVIFLLSNTLF